MTQLRGICIVLAAGLMMAAPCAALAQDQGHSSDTRTTSQPYRYRDTPGGVRVVYFHQANSDARIAAHYARADDRNADDAWKRGDRAAACRWAQTAQDDAGVHGLDTYIAHKVDEYCG